MTNDETRMTKECPNDEALKRQSQAHDLCGLGLQISFVICHSSFGFCFV